MNSFLIYLITSIFFSSNILPYFSLYIPDSGDIKKIEDSFYYLEQQSKMSDLEISASSAVVFDNRKNIFVLEKNSEQVWPIASISKLVSALVLLDDLNIDLDQYYQLAENDRRFGGRDYLYTGDILKNYDLLALSLIASDNTAIVAMISSLGLSEDDFASLMNKKAINLNLKKTKFYDATGLSPKNVSTAKEVSIIIKKAFENNKIAELLQKNDYSIKTKKNREIKIISTNELLRPTYPSNKEDVKIIGGKTGYNDSAGYCLATKFSIKNNFDFISVVLNSSSLKNRFIDTRELLDQTYIFYNN